MRPIESNLKIAIRKLLENGYSVYVSNADFYQECCYCFFVKNDKIGYVETDLCGFSFSTVNKPCSEVGTGFVIHKGSFSLILAEESRLTTSPEWVKGAYRSAVKKYRDWKEFAKLSTLTYSEVTLADLLQGAE